jgi:hypothetical protein
VTLLALSVFLINPLVKAYLHSDRVDSDLLETFLALDHVAQDSALRISGLEDIFHHDR